jgi:hypothetical protein
VPEGLLTIVQRFNFNVGCRIQSLPSPGGTAEWYRIARFATKPLASLIGWCYRLNSAVPSGLMIPGHLDPTLKRQKCMASTPGSRFSRVPVGKDNQFGCAPITAHFGRLLARGAIAFSCRANKCFSHFPGLGHAFLRLKRWAIVEHPSGMNQESYSRGRPRLRLEWHLASLPHCEHQNAFVQAGFVVERAKILRPADEAYLEALRPTLRCEARRALIAGTRPD